jgi:hypothetical protein
MNEPVTLSASLKQDFTVENHNATNVSYADEPKELGEEQAKRLFRCFKPMSHCKNKQ